MSLSEDLHGLSVHDYKSSDELKSRLLMAKSITSENYRKSQILQAMQDVDNLNYKVLFELLCGGIDSWMDKPIESEYKSIFSWN